MPKLSLSTIGIVIVLVAAVAGVYLYSTGGLPQIVNEQKETQEQQEILSIAGKVTSVEVGSNSFVLLQVKEQQEFTVKLNEETDFIRLVFPFDLANPPAEASFTPKREVVTIEDLQVGDQVFVRSESAIKNGQDIVNPLEVQILP